MIEKVFEKKKNIQRNEMKSFVKKSFDNKQFVNKGYEKKSLKNNFMDLKKNIGKTKLLNEKSLINKSFSMVRTKFVKRY